MDNHIDTNDILFYYVSSTESAFAMLPCCLAPYGFVVSLIAGAHGSQPCVELWSVQKYGSLPSKIEYRGGYDAVRYS